MHIRNGCIRRREQQLKEKIMTEYTIRITKPSKTKDEIQKRCHALGFDPLDTALTILTNYGSITIGTNQILGFSDRKPTAEKQPSTLIETITQYEQAKGLPKGYVVIQRFAIGKYRPYENIIMDKWGDLYKCPLYDGINQIENKTRIHKTFEEYITDMFKDWMQSLN